MTVPSGFSPEKEPLAAPGLYPSTGEGTGAQSLDQRLLLQVDPGSDIIE